MAQQQQDVDTLKRRGRRRLVGAIALVLLAVIILPMVFDPEPRPVVPPVSVRIPGEDDTPFKPKPLPPKGEYVVLLGAYTNPDRVTAKLAAAKIPYYTEAAQGNLIRVRAGPFPSKEAADEAAGKLKGLGLQPGAVTLK
jgi:cell division septation protein DedD